MGIFTGDSDYREADIMDIIINKLENINNPKHKYLVHAPNTDSNIDKVNKRVSLLIEVVESLCQEIKELKKKNE